MMSLEESTDANTEALKASTVMMAALIKQLQGGAKTPAATPAAGKTAATAPAKAAKGPKHDRKEVVGIAMKVKADISEASAVNLIAKFANGGTMKDMPEGNYDKFYAAAEEALESGEEIEADDGEGGL